MRFLIKLATRGRRANFLRSISNLHQTIGIPVDDYLIVVSCDDNDPEMDHEDVRQVSPEGGNVKVFYAPQTDKVGAINRDSHMFQEFDVIVNSSDDMVWVMQGWAKKIESDVQKYFNGSLDCFLHYNDNFVGDKLPTLNICGIDYYNRFGYIYHPSFHSVSCDSENFFVSQMLGKHKYINDILFHHAHPANLRFPTDATYMGNNKWDAIDVENYFQRREKLFYVDKPVCIPYNPLIRE